MKELQDITLSYIDKKGAVKLINFSDEFDAWEKDKQIEYLKALSSALNHAAETAYKERDEMVEKMEHVMTLNANAASKVETSDTIMIQVLTECNQARQELHDVIAELKQEIREKDEYIKATID